MGGRNAFELSATNDIGSPQMGMKRSEKFACSRKCLLHFKWLQWIDNNEFLWVSAIDCSCVCASVCEIRWLFDDKCIALIWHLLYRNVIEFPTKVIIYFQSQKQGEDKECKPNPQHFTHISFESFNFFHFSVVSLFIFRNVAYYVALTHTHTPPPINHAHCRCIFLRYAYGLPIARFVSFVCAHSATLFVPVFGTHILAIEFI